MVMLLLHVLRMLMLVHRLLLLRPWLTPWRRRLSSARHGRMRCVLGRGGRGMRLTDLIRLVRLLPLVTHLRLLRMLLHVLPMLSVMCLL